MYHRQYNSHSSSLSSSPPFSSTMSTTERIQIRFEIWCESIVDWFNSVSDSLRRPLMMLAAIALVMTLRSAKRGISSAKSGLVAGTSVLKTTGLTTAAAAASSYPQVGGQQQQQQQQQSRSMMGTASGMGVGGSSNYPYGTEAGGPSMYSTGVGAYGGPTPAGLGMGAGAGGSMYGSNAYGNPPPYNGGSAGGSFYLPSSSSSSSSYSSYSSGSSSYVVAGNYPPSPHARATSDLIDRNGPQAVSVVEPGLLRDYGGEAEFAGQIETLQAFEGFAVVEQVLNGPGQNRVLVIDGSGSLRAAVFDANLAQTAMKNGWRGVIINGAVRNSRGLAGVQFGVKALGTSPTRGHATQGGRSGGLQFGGVQFNPGWFVYADRDGVVVSQRDLSSTVPAIPSLRGGEGAAPPMGPVYGGGANVSGIARTGAVGVGVAPGGNLRGSVVSGQQPPPTATSPGTLRRIGVGSTATAPTTARQPTTTATSTAAAAAAARYPTRGGYNPRANKSKRFVGKFIGVCFLLTSFVLLVKSA